MRLLDYLRVSWAGVVEHKRQVGIVVVIIGTLFGVLIAACMLTKGIEEATLAAQTEATNGQIMLLVEVDKTVCGEDCNLKQSLATMRKKIESYGGELLSTERYETEDGTFYKIPEGVFAGELKVADDGEDIATILASVEAILRWQQILVAPGALYEERLGLVDEVFRERGEVIESKRGIGMLARAGERYLVGGILPSANGVTSLALGWVSETQNALDLILSNLEVGGSLNFVQNPNAEMRERVVEMSDDGQAFAVFSSAEDALAYANDAANVCSDTLIMMHSCPQSYQFRVTEAVGRPVSNARAFQGIWKTLHMLTAILCIVAVIVTVSTFLRLLGGEKRTIALYYALGASKFGVIGIYLVYFYVICVIAMVFALMLALTIVFVVNMVSAESLMQVFVLGFGRPEQRIFLVGWTNEIVMLLAVLRATALMSIVLGLGAFSQRNIMRRMK